MGLLKGIPVVLYLRTDTGQKDGFGDPIYSETETTVNNVLVNPIAADALTSDLQLYGIRGAYELCIPKGDTHDWSGCRVDFFGYSWRVYTPPEEWIEAMVPLDWNRKVRVERYDSESQAQQQGSAGTSSVQ